MIDQTLLTDIQNAVVEPPDGGQAWPSGLWTRDEVLGFSNQRQDRLLKNTFIRVTAVNLSIVATQHIVDLPADWMRTLEVVWRGVDGTVRELPRSDTFEADHLVPTWETTDVTTPLVWAEYDVPNRQIRIMPAPSINGTLSLLYFAVGTELTAEGVTLAVPDEIAQTVLKYGILADLLSKDGRGKDVGRAAYCEERYQLGIEVIRILMKGWA